MDQVIRFLRARPWARRALSGVSVVLLAAAVGMLSYPVWTNFESDRRQQALDRELASPQIKQAYEARALQDGDALTRIKIPAIDVDTVVVEGTTPSALKAGAGHYPKSALPCDAGNVAIAGHRTTYGKPFANLDRLRVGDHIELTTPVGSCTYEVVQFGSSTSYRIISPRDVSVVDPTEESVLTLTTCHPRGSAKQRLIIRAALVSDPSVKA